ncbi:Probable siderophore transport system ATP-binding protein YusV [Weissella viridescens]|uniref:Probable siderophore transport system ATP-binding protein YusV n=1 Tax=Weissella viridescens TaxID=1629 RepID=A0A380NXM8_WEIVI|nr:Probable siderophore transport system ATP-binding protein YusV [Weissella viridescens]
MTVGYTSTPVFEDLSVKFEPGKITGIIGPNGAGKSTLIKSILGLIKKQAGDVKLDGQEVSKVRQKTAYVEQRANLDMSFPINVFDVVLTGTYGRLGLFKSPGAKEKAAASDALEQLKLSEFKKRQIGELSGGQLQRVFVARAVVQEAEVVILDEPFVGIDMKSEADIMRILKLWRDQGKTIIVIHHDLNKVTEYFDDLVIMNHGIVAAGPVADVYTRENIGHAFSADLGNVLFEDKGTLKMFASITEFVSALGQYNFLQSALMASIMVGIMSGLIGSFIILRGMSLMGDAISHSVLPGVAVAYMLGINLMLGATAFGVLAALLIGYVSQHSKLKNDTSIGIVFSAFFALGFILISMAGSSTNLHHILLVTSWPFRTQTC